MRRQDDWIAILAMIAVLAILVGGWLIWTQAPCGFWSFSSVGDMPTRCL